MPKHQWIEETEEIVELLRTEENYFEDAETNNMTLTGVKDWSVFNAIPHYHVVNGSANDLTHDLLEGVLPYCLFCALVLLIFERGNRYSLLCKLLTFET